MTKALLPELPAGSPAGVQARWACEIPAGAWIAPLGESMNPAAWRPTYDRWVTQECAVFVHERPSRGKASVTSKFPRQMWLVWCHIQPVFTGVAP